uniref:Uncharacterized protein n=1 Tax=Neobacillus citreus TaxID=2833578 RepID=A0A942Y8M4_9BACI
MGVSVGTLVSLLVGIATVGVAAVRADADAGVAAAPGWTPSAVDSGAPPVAAAFVAPTDVHQTRAGALLVADYAGNGVLERSPGGTWRTVAGFGTHEQAMWNPSAVTSLADGRLLVAEAGRRSVALLGPGDGQVERFPAPPTRSAVSALAVVGSTVFAAAPGSGALWTVDLQGDRDQWAVVDGPWTDPSGVAVSADGATVVVADASADEVWQLDRATGTARALGFPDDGQVRLLGVATVPGGGVVVVDNAGGRVWAWSDPSWSVAFAAAPDGSPLVNPTSVAVGSAGELVVADYNRQRIVTASRNVVVEPEPAVGTPGTPSPPVGSPSPDAPASPPVGSPSPDAPASPPVGSPSPDAPASPPVGSLSPEASPSPTPSRSPEPTRPPEPTRSPDATPAPGPTTPGSTTPGPTASWSGPRSTDDSVATSTSATDRAALAWTGAALLVPVGVAGALLAAGLALVAGPVLAARRRPRRSARPARHAPERGAPR